MRQGATLEQFQKPKFVNILKQNKWSQFDIDSGVLKTRATTKILNLSKE